ncbi:YbaN family protein [Hydrogenophaga sp.]|uniref:YbaN family protein n=1 Tax=Hydrogenophaga sp. TaxID=1904254 RepID=UPI0027322BDA|nr:YbaN family protein [Hydrogenophaga sp.]MDP2018197.1 YbaN family protein [Hydrogenophaga sp.]MDP3164750.1 YbaN family protein [Hydrogenophaga sp.]
MTQARTPAPDSAALHRSRVIRWLLWLAGSVSLALGLIGVLLPGLPTTPFVLLAAACYAKASPRLHGWLLNHRFLGPMVRDWEQHRSLTRRSKTVAQVSMVVMVGLSAWGLRERPVVLAVVLIAALVGVWVVARIPTRTPPA